MAFEIIETPPPLSSAWLQGLGPSAARRLIDWEQAHADALLADVFGYHALQLGLPALASLRANRMPHRWAAGTEYECEDTQIPVGACGLESLWMDSRAWPWPAESLDLVVLPHTLEQSSDPHACLREAERTLIPEGQLFITGINPWSFWGWRQRRFARQQCINDSRCHVGQLLGYSRLRDWLGLMGFEVQISRFGGRTTALKSGRWSWLARWGQRWWPMWGGAYLIVATKRVPGGRLLTHRAWRKVRSSASSTVPVARTDVGSSHHRP